MNPAWLDTVGESDVALLMFRFKDNYVHILFYML